MTRKINREEVFITVLVEIRGQSFGHRFQLNSNNAINNHIFKQSRIEVEKQVRKLEAEGLPDETPIEEPPVPSP